MTIHRPSGLNMQTTWSDSNIEGRDDHPVVHVCWEDALAYAQWAGKRLPTEAEWEFAARGGLKSANFTWGDEPFSNTKPQANIWQGGDFPHDNTRTDGYVRTAPVKSFSPNGFGLYDMSGNVWEWCADWWRVDLYRHRMGKGEPVSPLGLLDRCILRTLPGHPRMSRRRDICSVLLALRARNRRAVAQVCS